MPDQAQTWVKQRSRRGFRGDPVRAGVLVPCRGKAGAGRFVVFTDLPHSTTGKIQRHLVEK